MVLGCFLLSSLLWKVSTWLVVFRGSEGQELEATVTEGWALPRAEVL